MSEALILLKSGNLLGTWTPSKELPREGDVIQLYEYAEFYRVTTIVWVVAKEVTAMLPSLYLHRLVRIFVEDLSSEDPYILAKALQKIESQGL